MAKIPIILFIFVDGLRKLPASPNSESVRQAIPGENDSFGIVPSINPLNPKRDMEANIKAIHFDISEKLVAFVNKKIEKLTRRFEAITDVDVNLRLVKPETALNKEAGIKLAIPGCPDLFASKTADTFEEAIDLSLEALEKQLEKIKEKK